MSQIPETQLKRRRSGEKIDMKSGELMIVRAHDQRSLKFRVFMKIIGNCYEHHAQIYTDADYSTQYGAISLRNCTVTNDAADARSFSVQVVRNGRESPCGMQFEATSEEEAAEWVTAMKPRFLDVSPACLLSPNTSPVMPKREQFGGSPDYLLSPNTFPVLPKRDHLNTVPGFPVSPLASPVTPRKAQLERAKGLPTVPTTYLSTLNTSSPVFLRRE